MLVLWVTLLLLHRGCSLVPVTQVELDKPVTLTCVLPVRDLQSKKLNWYKQSVGDTLKLIATLMKFTTVVYSPEFSQSRLDVKYMDNISTLTIQRTIHEDEALYHCAVVDWNNITWTGMYLSVKGNSQRMSNYTVVDGSTVSGPVRPGDSMTLQCSVLSDPETTMCPGGHSMFWFRAGSDKSHPGIIYTDGDGECEEKSESVKRCVYRFSKNVSSSDAGTYRCAVATCGQILFGDGTKVDNEPVSQLHVQVILMVCLAISVILNIIFICDRISRTVRQQSKEITDASLQARPASSSHLVHDVAEGEPELNYAALHFSEGRASKGKRKTEECVYAPVNTSK